MMLVDLFATVWRVRSRVAATAIAAATLAACRSADVEAPTEMVRISPATLSVEGAWGLFDRSTVSGFLPDDGVIRATLDHHEQLTALKLYGSAPYRLRVTGRDGSTLGFSTIDLSKLSAGWHLIESSALISTDLVELRFESTGAPGKIPELELWATGDAGQAAPIDLAASDLPAGFVRITPNTKSADLEPGDCGTFEIQLSRAPSTFEHLYLAFEAEGLFRTFALKRSINGLAEHGGNWLAGDPSRRTFVEELDPGALHLGRNELRLCVPTNASRGVALADVHLVGDLDRGSALVAAATFGTRELPGDALLDGKTDTSANIAAGERLVLSFDRLIAPDAVVFSGRTLDPAALTSIECLDRKNGSTPLAVKTRLAGDDAIVALDGGRAACAAVALTYATDVSLSAIDVIGSGAGEAVDWPHVVVTSPREHFGDTAWIAGFTARPSEMAGAIRVRVADRPADAMTGDFGRMLARGSDGAAAWPVGVNAAFPDGTTQSLQILLDRDQRAQLTVPPTTSTTLSANATTAVAPKTPFGLEGDSVVQRVRKLESSSIRLGTHIGVDVPIGAVEQITNITVRHLGKDVLPPLDPGMINVTAPKDRGYEFMPHGQKFKKKVEVVVPYDTSLIPEGMSADDVFTFFYDPKAERWVKLDRAAIDIAQRTTRSSTDHFTIMINAVLAVPKNATPLSFDPTALTSIGAASPAANIDLIEPPAANSTGDARLSLPIRLPPGRGKYSPSLGLSYSSSAGNGQVGVGWDLSTSKIEIDTRWGVPNYASSDGHRYILDGAALVPTLETEGPTCSSNQPGRRFHARVEGGFAHILRCGDATTNYHWEVRDRDGTLFVYGSDAATNPDDWETDPSRASLGSYAAPKGIVRWNLRRVVDVYGNTTEFSYRADSTPGGEPSRDTYLDTIAYTSHTSGKTASYSVHVVLDDGMRPDRIVSGRGGFKQVTKHLVRAIEVKFGSEIIREYVLTYAHGQFDKSVLARVAVYGLGGCNASGNAFQAPSCSATFFNEHTFDYYREDEGFAPVQRLSATGPNSGLPFLTQNKATTWSGNISFGVAEGTEVGATLSRQERNEEIGLYDINGDGLVDQLFSDGTVLYNQSRPDRMPSSGPLFAPVGPVLTHGFPAMPRDIQWSSGVSAKFGLEGDGFGGTLSAGFESAWSRATRLLTDVNGDNFIDVVYAEDDGRHDAGTADLGHRCGTNNSEMCFSTTPVLQFDPYDDPVLQQVAQDVAARTFVVDPVVQWTAPFDGEIVINGTATKAGAGGVDGVAVELYADDTLLERVAIGANDTSPVLFPAAEQQVRNVSKGDTLYLRVKTGNDEAIGPNNALLDLVDAQLLVRYSRACHGASCAPIPVGYEGRDPTGAPVTVFDSKHDLRVAGSPRGFIAPVRGTLQLDAQLTKRVSAAPLRVCVQRLPSLAEQTFDRRLDFACSRSAFNMSGTIDLPAGSTASVPLSLAFPIDLGQVVVVRVESDLSFDPADVALVATGSDVPVLSFLSVCPVNDDGSPGACSSDPDQIDEVPVSTTGFGASVFLAEASGLPYVAPYTAQIEVEHPTVGGDYLYAIRSAEDGIIRIEECRGGTTCAIGDDIFQVHSGDSITFELLVESPLYTGARTLSAKRGNETFEVPLTVRTFVAHNDDTPFAGGYRGWRAAMWNENKPFEPGPLLADYADLESQTIERQREITRTAFTPFAMTNSVFVNGSAWAAPLSAAFVSAAGLHAARLGLGDSDASDANRGGLFAGKFARQSITRSLYLGAEASLKEVPVASLTLQATKSTTDSTVDLVDLDGDGVLDVIGGKNTFLRILQLLVPATALFDLGGGFRKRTGHEYSIGFGGHAIRRTTTPGGRTVAADSNTAPKGIFGGTGYAIARTQSEDDLVDVSGDGLPDRVRRRGSLILVQYNLGSRFGAEDVIGTIEYNMRRPVDDFERSVETLELGPFSLDSTNNALQHDTTITKNKHAGLNISTPIGELSAGRSTVTTSTRTTRQLADLNGDGLPDLLVKRHGETDDDDKPTMWVQFNLGGTFGPARRWSAESWPGGALPAPLELDLHLGGKLAALALTGPDVLGLTGASNTGYSASLSILGNGGGGGRTKSRDRFEMGLLDINGDGAADHVLRRFGAGAQDEILVKANKVTGQANLLHEVRRPLGAVLTLEYTRVGNTVDTPESKHVLSKVTVDDGVDLGAGFASPNIVTTFAYAGGVHHRNEKEFFGFHTVTTTRSDGVSIEEEYENDLSKYPLRGRLLRQTKRDGGGHLFTEKRLTYQVRPVTDASGFPVAIDPVCIETLHPLLAAQVDACIPRFPVVEREETTRSEGGTLAKTHRTHDEAFDRFGNVLTTVDEGDDAIVSDDISSTAQYQNDTARWILGRPTALEVHAGTAAGALLRQRSGTYNNLGDAQTLSVNTGTGIATTTLQYDGFGNLIFATSPPNSTGQTQTYEVQFDTESGTYPVLVRDGFGYTSTATYDLRFGIATTEVDVNNHSLVRTLDQFGRLKTVRGPYDSATAPGLTMDYFPAEAMPRAVTVTHASAPADYTGALPSDITAVTIADGLGQAIELRKTAAVGGVTGMTTSGFVERDTNGNVILAYQPFFTAGASTAFVAPQSTRATRTEYDAMDRPIRTTHPDGAVETTSFDVATDPDNRLMFVTHSVAANGNPREAYSDLNERVRALIEHPTHPQSGPAAITRYDYLATGELSRIVDAEANASTLAYDMRGLRTALSNPDTGLIEDRFDLMGNRVASIEPNHRALGVEVQYVFDRNRVSRIDYPSKPDVTYEYGAPGAPNNRAGRISRVTDESGSQEHFYGALGEARKTIRTVLPDQSNQSVVFETTFVADSLGRQLQMRYPDGVTLTNTYDAGGMLARVAGAGDGWTRTYASDVQYDVFGNRTLMRLGNGALTTWAYDPQRVRLQRVTTIVGSPQKKLQDLNYTYDATGNPKTITNQLAPLSGGSGNMPGESTLTMTYDGVDRLTRSEGDAQLSAQKRTSYSLTFAYSASHNITNKARTHIITQPSVIPTVPSDTNFASTYSYAPTRPHQPLQVGDLVLTYDPSGNPRLRTKQGTGSQQTLVWDDDNRLVDVSSSGTHQRNTYDASGLRVRRKSTQSETLFASQYFDVEGGTQGVRHVFVGGTRVASEADKFQGGVSPMPPKKLGTVYFFHQDHLGSTSLLTNADGSVQESVEFFSDGETWLDRGPQKPVNRYLFSGKPFDPDTGFYDFGQRYYDPRTSLWLGVDAAFTDSPEGAVARPLMLSVAAYAAHSPGMLVDPDGRDPKKPTAIGLRYSNYVTTPRLQRASKIIEGAINRLPQERLGRVVARSGAKLSAAKDVTGQAPSTDQRSIHFILIDTFDSKSRKAAASAAPTRVPDLDDVLVYREPGSIAQADPGRPEVLIGVDRFVGDFDSQVRPRTGLPALDKIFEDASMADFADYLVNHEGGHSAGARHTDKDGKPVKGIMKDGLPSVTGKALRDIDFSKESAEQIKDDLSRR